ncbi:MAG: hypothetical protein ABSC00_10135 [Acidimicrobiales bacterium]|jgi:hypothetical protein
MKRFMNRKVVTIGVAVGLTLGIAGAALAYFTSSGTGSGTAATATAGTISISGDGITGLAPGAGPQAVNFTLTASVANSYVDTVTASLPTAANPSIATEQDVTSNGTTPIAGCQAAWFSFDPSSGVSTVGQEVAIGTPVDDTSTGLTLTLNESGGPQTACQNASIYVSFSST